MADTPPASDLPSRIAGFLEDLAVRIRSLTVDRMATAVTWSAVGIPLAVMLLLILIWFLVAGFRALGTLIGQELGYAIVGGVLVIVGGVLWAMRFRKGSKTGEEGT